jgi:hypothetical protein
MVRTLWVVVLGALLSCLPPVAQAGLVSQDTALTPPVVRAAPGDVLETHQYRLPEARVAGQQSVRQRVTAWEVTSGAWDGVNLKGLSLVLVQNTPDSNEYASTVSCYISHMATPTQRQALLAAYASAQAVSPSDMGQWRIEPAVISFEITGQHIVLHLGLVA